MQLQMFLYKKNNDMMVRILFSALVIVGIFLLPWWVTLAYGIFGLWVYPRYYEIFLIGIGISAFINPWAWIMALGAWIVVSFVKKYTL